MTKKIGILLLLAMGFSLGFAQDNAPQDPLKAYDAAMKKLNFLVGEWQPEALAYNPETKAWEPKELRSEQGSTVKVETMTVAKGMTIFIPGETNYVGAVSYDVVQNRYRMVFVDSAIGLLDVYEGSFEGDELHLSNVGSGTHFKHMGQTFNSRLKFKPQPGNGWKLVVEMSGDQGANWFQAYKLSTTPVS